MKYNLPRNYLSYSAYKMWCSSPKSYRKRYYLNETPFRTPQTDFGRLIGNVVETEDYSKDPVLSKIVNYSEKEYKIETMLDDLPLLGYLDQLNLEDLAIMEMKTGHRSKTGKAPWDRLKVRKHEQLVFYCMLIELMHGKYNPDVILQWIETEKVSEVKDERGHVLMEQVARIEMTGVIETFERTVGEWEVEAMKTKVLIVAQEISEDYTEWQKVA